MASKANFKELTRFVYECGQLKKYPRSGWLSISIPNPESIADHSFRTAVIGFFLSRLEGADAQRVLELCVFHDVHEARVGDQDWITSRYLEKDEQKAANDITKGLFCEKELKSLFKESSEKKTLESRVAKDADLLDMIAQAREYADAGNEYALEWIPEAKKSLFTKSAGKLAERLEKTSSNQYWMDMPPPKKKRARR